MAVAIPTFLDQADSPEFSLVEILLRQQQQLTAVEQFAQAHDTDQLPLQQRYYQDLLPLSAPGPGQQYAFEVDLDCCSGCKACVTACHTLNGLDDNETWRDVGLLHGGSSELPVLQHVTTACHHCLDPACLNACPVNAYEKDAKTGIVKHLDDQCFGCQYCVLSCPYDVPKYNPRRGIVRKCDMCSSRLAVGEAPACVQACPHQAIRIQVVNRADIAADCESSMFLPGAPDPHWTQPTTNYKSSRPLPRNTLPADYFAVHREHAHLPLVLMLVLTQLSVGAFVVDLLLEKVSAAAGQVATTVDITVEPARCVGALAFGLLALAASTCHLGRPQYAYRAVLGLRHSWLSREIVAFGVFALLAAIYSVVCWLAPSAGPDALQLRTGLSVAVSGIGLLAVFCSVMVYQSTRRPLWNATNVNGRFFLTTLQLGICAVLFTSHVAAGYSTAISAGDILHAHGRLLCQALVVVTLAKLLFEASIFVHLGRKHTTPLKRSAMLMRGQLAGITLHRFGWGFLGGVLLPYLLLDGTTVRTEGYSDAALATLVSVAFLASLIGELCERYLFFTAAVAPRMPGGLQ